MKTIKEKLTDFAVLLEQDQLTGLIRRGVDCESNRTGAKTSVKIGKKYARVDVGSSGKYMVDMATQQIFGIKAYGVIHRGHEFGTLDTIANYYWGNYRAEIKP